MTRLATFSQLTFSLTAVLPALTFVAGLATAQFIVTGDRYFPQDATYGEHHRRGARSVVLPDATAAPALPADSAARRGARITAGPDRFADSADAIIAATGPRARSIARQ